MATHSNILSKKIPRDREAWGVYGPWGHKRVDWTEQLNKHAFLTPGLSVFNHKWSSEITLLQVMLIQHHRNFVVCQVLLTVG